MENKRLYRKCETCEKSLSVRRENDEYFEDFYKQKQIYVQWISSPFSVEIHNDYTRMWLCDICEYESAMDI